MSMLLFQGVSAKRLVWRDCFGLASVRGWCYPLHDFMRSGCGLGHRALCGLFSRVHRTSLVRRKSPWDGAWPRHRHSDLGILRARP